MKCGNSKCRICGNVEFSADMCENSEFIWFFGGRVVGLDVIEDNTNLTRVIYRKMFKEFDKFQRKSLRNLHGQTIYLHILIYSVSKISTRYAKFEDNLKIEAKL